MSLSTLKDLLQAYFQDYDISRLPIIRDAAEEAGRQDVIDVLDKWRLVKPDKDKYKNSWFVPYVLYVIEKRNISWDYYNFFGDKKRALHGFCMHLKFHLPEDVVRS